MAFIFLRLRWPLSFSDIPTQKILYHTMYTSSGICKEIDSTVECGTRLAAIYSMYKRNLSYVQQQQLVLESKSKLAERLLPSVCDSCHILLLSNASTLMFLHQQKCAVSEYLPGG